jgi:hypothetical protein
VRPFTRRRLPPLHNQGPREEASASPTNAPFDGDDQPGQQTLRVRHLLEWGLTLTEVSFITAVPDALVQLIAEELAEAP